MKRFDVIVIGGTRAGLAVADALSVGRSVAVVRMSGDDAADRLTAAIEDVTEVAPDAVRFEALDGPARFLSPTRIATAGGEFEAARFVIAVGAVPSGEWELGEGPFPPLLEAFTGPAPASAAVLGAGPAAVMAADRLARRGTSVSIVTRAPRLLPLEDESAAGVITGRFLARGIQIHAGATALGWAPSGVTRWNTAGVAGEVKTDALFAGADARAATDGLDLKKAGVFADVTGRIVVNEEMRTSAPRIWAVGHATSPGGALAEHAAQVELAAHNVVAGLFSRRKAEPGSPPYILRTTPTLARVGLTEAAARARHSDVVVAIAPWFDSHGAAEAGLIKIVGRRRGGRLLGAHIVGTGAAETIIFFDLLLRAELPLDDVPDRRHFPLPGATDAVYRALLAWGVAAHGS